jgi:hypothetical protein
MDTIDITILDDLTDNLNNIIAKFNNFVININTYKNVESINFIRLDIIKFGILCNKLDEITQRCNFIQKNIINIVNLKIIDISDNTDSINRVLTNKFTNEYSLLVNNNVHIINNNLQTKNIIPNNTNNIDSNNINNKLINIPVCVVENESVIKNSPIYYITNTNEFAIKINNNLIKGNIGNIFDKKQDKDKFNIMKCNNSICNTVNCKFYHDSSNNNFDNNNYYIRNFMNYSWNHIKYNKNNQINYLNNKKNTRFIGSRDTLIQDLVYATPNELDLRNSQLMHDILIYQVLNNYIN